MKKYASTLGFIIIMFVILLISCPKAFDGKSSIKDQESLTPTSELFLISKDWMQEPIFYVPSRFIKNKKIHFVALRDQDSITIFVPYQTITMKEYHMWLGKNTGAYELSLSE